MRLRPAALAAALTLGPATALAQPPLLTPGPVRERYNISGCVDGATRYVAATDRFIIGRVACFGGTAGLSLGMNGSLVLPVFEGVLTPEFGPEFEGGPMVNIEFGSEVSFIADLVRGGTAGFGGGVRLASASTVNPGFFLVGTPPIPEPFRAVGPGANEVFRPETIRDVRGRLLLNYRLPGAPAGSTVSTTVATLTFTPIPEPSTFALAAVGGVALAAGAVRRRRTPAG